MRVLMLAAVLVAACGGESDGIDFDAGNVDARMRDSGIDPVVDGSMPDPSLCQGCTCIPYVWGCEGDVLTYTGYCCPSEESPLSECDVVAYDEQDCSDIGRTCSPEGNDQVDHAHCASTGT